ncbi:aminotransferase class III-fold pyridoxal phosphate-dependent enzyme [Dokdonia sinensis]|uniref:Aminotransferase class III-fold pyridoxal phosphate-dependent enzyme n=1 Tax=Dokdonia sinensis TaxID=2479847 RepID=A0A3M0FWW0_9FLAO|nr:aminotransferase class III-fold pyridoxal phosphate-dependent enzyme [Dokdonia sinensis]RMB56948.1 aminotransferase class III-fold pyridoxal phosphate-dependent enzyme [Dokdonia sinensis]
MKLFDVYTLYDVTPVKAKGCYVYDEKGTEYLDLYGGHAVMSIGHGHPHYVKRLTEQLSNIGFYSNAVQNPLQQQVADKLGRLSGCEGYELFFVSSGAEANENALKLASFATQKHKVVAFKNGFHGRTSATVAATDNLSIVSPLNAQHEVAILELGDVSALEETLKNGDCCAVILEFIQGVGGLDESTAVFYKNVECLCKRYVVKLIADEVQSGFGRSGDFFAFQKYGIEPDIITMAKGMGNGFPVGGILVHPSIKAKHGMLGTTFGGNHLACAATLAVLEVLEKEHLMAHAREMESRFRELCSELVAESAKKLNLKVKGRGLMLGLDLGFDVSELRKKLIYEHYIFTGGAKNKNVLRILPPLNIKEEHFDVLFQALKKEL